MIYDASGEINQSEYAGAQWLLDRRLSPGSWNHFYISGPDALYPLLTVLVKDNIAVLHFFSADDVPPLLSQGDMAVGSDAIISFQETLEGNEFRMGLDTVVSAEVAARAVDEFVVTQKLPTCIKWRQL